LNEAYGGGATIRRGLQDKDKWLEEKALAGKGNSGEQEKDGEGEK
jgi:hypothetical protein